MSKKKAWRNRWSSAKIKSWTTKEVTWFFFMTRTCLNTWWEKSNNWKDQGRKAGMAGRKLFPGSHLLEENVTPWSMLDQAVWRLSLEPGSNWWSSQSLLGNREATLSTTSTATTLDWGILLRKIFLKRKLFLKNRSFPHSMTLFRKTKVTLKNLHQAMNEGKRVIF